MHLHHSQLAQLCSLCQREAEEACQPLLGLKNQTNCAQGFSEQVSMSKNTIAKFRLIKKNTSGWLIIAHRTAPRQELTKWCRTEL